MYFKHSRILGIFLQHSWQVVCHRVPKLPKTKNTVYLHIFTQSIAIKDSMFNSVNF